jgi:hypothetical protein
MKHIGLILKISDPTDWVSLIIFHQLHLAADPTSLTKMATPFVDDTNFDGYRCHQVPKLINK